MLYPSCPSPRKITHRGQKRGDLICSGACGKEETPSRQAGKPRPGEQAGWKGAGPGQIGVRPDLAIRKTLCSNQQAILHLLPQAPKPNVAGLQQDHGC